MSASCRTVAFGTLASAAEGQARASAVFGSCTITAAPAAAKRAAPRAPSALAPVSTTPMARARYAAAADSKSASMDGREQAQFIVQRIRGLLDDFFVPHERDGRIAALFRVHIVAVGDAVVVVEAVAGGKELGQVAQVPFADASGRIAAFF